MWLTVVLGTGAGSSSSSTSSSSSLSSSSSKGFEPAGAVLLGTVKLTTWGEEGHSEKWLVYTHTLHTYTDRHRHTCQGGKCFTIHTFQRRWNSCAFDTCWWVTNRLLRSFPTKNVQHIYFFAGQKQWSSALHLPCSREQTSVSSTVPRGDECSPRLTSSSCLRCLTQPLRGNIRDWRVSLHTDKYLRSNDLRKNQLNTQFSPQPHLIFKNGALSIPISQL